MNKLNNILGKLLPVVMLVVLCISCKDDTEDQLALSRQFSPASFDITSRETSVSLAWDPSLFSTGEMNYSFEVSKDPAFNVIEYSTTTTGLEVTILDTEIAIKTDYYARVKALSKGTSAESNWTVSPAFKILGEQFLLPVTSADVIDNKAILRWKIKPNLTRIVFTTGTQSFEVVLSGSDLAAGQKLISNLLPAASYTAEIFQGTLSKGVVSFTTKAAVTGNIIDLRGITKPSILLDTLPDIASGSVVLLKRGGFYDVSTSYSFDKTVTILSGLDFGTDLATIRLTSNFTLTAGSTIDSIVFKDVIFKGTRPAAASYGADYIINTNATVTPKATLTKLRLDNCIVKILRGVVRIQGGGGGVEIGNYFINKCVIDSIREYGVATASGLSLFKNISITNSTLYKMRRFVIHAVAGNNSLTIQNCTVNEIPSNSGTGPAANYFIDFAAFNSATPIVVKDCIIGKVWDELGTAVPTNYRIGTSSSISAPGTYYTTDKAFVLGDAYAGLSTALFTDPANGNFKIKDTGFVGKATAGDPRWK